MPKKSFLFIGQYRAPIAIALLLISRIVSADPLNGGIEIGTSVSHNYEARNVLTNPAALGYETALNGAELMSSFSWGINQGYRDDLSVGLTFGYLGFGYERLMGQERFNLAGGIPLGTSLFLGGRYAWGTTKSSDLGLQYRPFRFASFGFEANHLNQATIQYVAGVTLRPIDQLTVSFDADTPSQDFAKHFGYQVTAGVEPLPGITLRAGYHETYHFQAGIQINLGRAALFSGWQPDSVRSRVVSGFQVTATNHPSFVRPRQAMEVKLDGSLGEQARKGGLFGGDRPSFLELLMKLKDAGKNPAISLVLVKIDGFPLGLAAAQELFETLLKLRQSGKKVVATIGQGSLKEYLIASAATTIVMEPSGELRFLGPKAERYFIKGTLDKIGVEGEFFARGEYKSAPEMFTRKDSSPISRDVTLQQLQRVEEELLPLLAKAREITPERFHKALTAALFSAEDAKGAGFVDKIAHVDREVETLRREYVFTDQPADRSDRLSLPPRVAVIVAHGDILEKRVGLLSLGGEAQVTPAKLDRDFKKAMADPRTKAIVLRVSSPGGEVMASDEIAGMIERVKAVKPVFVSMGDVAASGGYMISAPANRIFAEPLTVTGSIGVFLGKFNLAGLFNKIDLKKEVLSYAPFASLYSEDRALNAEGKQVLVRRLNQYYESFVDYVAKHRGIAKEDAEKAAKGRVWLGEQARNLKLTDEKGGYLDTVRYAANHMSLPSDYDVWEIEEEAPLFQLFGDDFPLARGQAVHPLLSSLAETELRWIESLKENPFLYLSPISKFE